MWTRVSWCIEGFLDIQEHASLEHVAVEMSGDVIHRPHTEKRAL
jgi:hypothetical protein